MIQQQIDSLSVMPDSLYNVAVALSEGAMSTAEAVYGAASRVVERSGAVETAASNPEALTGNVFFDVAVLACFVSLCLIVYFYRGYAFGIFGVLRGGTTTDKMLGERSKVFGAFLTAVISLGLLITGLCVLKFADLYLGAHMTGLSGWLAVVPILGAWAGVALIWGYQFVFLRVAGSLSLSQEFVGRLFHLKKIVAAIGTITVLPVFLLFALSDGQSALVLAILIAAIAVLLTIFLIIRTFMLFVHHNFPILLWFLYFCAVEIFPVSLVAVTATKVIG